MITVDEIKQQFQLVIDTLTCTRIKTSIHNMSKSNKIFDTTKALSLYVAMMGHPIRKNLYLKKKNCNIYKLLGKCLFKYFDEYFISLKKKKTVKFILNPFFLYHYKVIQKLIELY